MSENLKRAESLFNRIMNQNKPASEKTFSGRGNGNNNGSMNGNSGTSNSNNNERNGQSGLNGHQRHHRPYKHHGYNNSNGSHVAPSVNVPKRDPVREAAEAVSALVGEQHVLPYCWTIWHHSRSKHKTAAASTEEVPADKTGLVAVDLYLQAATEIEFPQFGNPSELVKPIASLEQMWVSLSTIKKTHDLLNGSELLIFKTGVNPVWEDPVNSKGGRWVFRFSHRSNTSATAEVQSLDMINKGRRRATLVWERLVLKTLTGSLLSGRRDGQDALLSDIAGVVLSVRKDEVIISLWNLNVHFKKKQDEDDKKGVLTNFTARRVYCDAILKVIREVDAILEGSDCIDTQSLLSSERVGGVTFEYRLHLDNSHLYNDRYRRGKSYHHHSKDEKEEDS